ncbi:MAG TPA: MoaD/ThiS family protein, partial [Thermofilaceae archaeon]|nr:MoaD/ThiS family protein [Thermofilaceae archaeon]
MPSIEIRYFSIVRDAVGKEREELEVEEGAT